MLNGLDKWVTGFLSLGIFAAVAAIVLVSVQSATTACETTGTILNTTTKTCVNVSAQSQTLTGTSLQYNATGGAIDGVVNLTAQFGTAGTLVGLGILALAALMILAYFRRGSRN